MSDIDIKFDTQNRCQLVVAAEGFAIAEKNAMNAVREYYYVGKRVFWEHGRHVRSGRICDIAGNSFHYMRALIESDVSQKRSWIYVSALMSYETLRIERGSGT